MTVNLSFVGFQRNLFGEFRKTRDSKVQRAAVETNRLLIRLEKVSFLLFGSRKVGLLCMQMQSFFSVVHVCTVAETTKGRKDSEAQTIQRSVLNGGPFFWQMFLIAVKIFSSQFSTIVGCICKLI